MQRAEPPARAPPAPGEAWAAPLVPSWPNRPDRHQRQRRPIAQTRSRRERRGPGGLCEPKPTLPSGQGFALAGRVVWVNRARAGPDWVRGLDWVRGRGRGSTAAEWLELP